MHNYANNINELEFTSFESIRNVAFQRSEGITITKNCASDLSLI